MDIREKGVMSEEEERSHWWIRTRFQYIDLATSFIRKKEINLLEYGCGTGQNLWYARLQSKLKNKFKNSIGIDPELPHDFTPSWGAEDHHFSSDLNIELKKTPQLILAMDVLEHIEDDREALKGWVQKIDPDGVILITVPAFQSLWSYHDEFLGHYRRYTTKQLEKVANEVGLKPLYLKYSFSYLYFPVLIIRKLLTDKKNTSDLKLPNIIINKIMTWLGKVEYWTGGNSFVGTSVIGIFSIDKNK